MSDENVRMVREAFDAFGTEEAVPYWDENVIVTPPEGWPEGGEVRGLDAWRRQLQRLRDSWESPQIEIDQIRPVGDDQVLTLFRYITTGKDSGIPFDTPMGSLHTIRNGKIVRADFFRSPAKALEAAGLLE
jgi:ketosteroid isomerase-like protein